MEWSVQDWTDVVLLAGAAVGLVIAVWRSRTAEKQVRAAEQQVKISEQSARDERFKTAIECLGSDSWVTRLGAVQMLFDLSNLEPDPYHVRMMELFSELLASSPEHLRHLEVEEGVSVKTHIGDTEKAVEIINNRDNSRRELETKAGFDIRRKVVGPVFSVTDDGNITTNLDLVIREHARAQDRQSSRIIKTPSL